MRLFGLDIRRASNIDAAPRPTQQALTRIKQRTLYRIKQSISDWHNAIEEAEDIDRPNNEELMRLYRALILDPHVSALMDTLLFQVRANKFFIYSGDDVDEAATDLFAGRWFLDFIRYAIEARYYGFSFVQIDGVRDDMITGITPIPREHIIPQWQMIKTHPSNYTGIDFTRPPLDRWNIFLGDKHDLGLLAKAGPYVIWKREVMQFWAAYNELFGQPLRVGKTNMSDKRRVDNMVAAMENMSFASWMVTHVDDEIEFLASSGASGQDTYEKFVRLADEQLSKLFAGQTMVLDNGSSRSQSEVHERNLGSFVNSMMTEVAHCINMELLPRMAKIGLPVNDSHYFAWVQGEKMTMMQKADIVAKISPYYKLDRDYIEETLEVRLAEEPEEIVSDDIPAGAKAMMDTAAYYAEAMAHINHKH